ncbi:hypothetical protein [Pedobacter sp. BMA]|uniref:hypothetical protein n=1 Tax=Pedobacter sp. BMA TaxID=1663685 RepID=UPI00064A25D3|nr:hypothetical protein [Pedobacter sp. BMA]KLT67031.1 hypothetical protein AB669_03700 [Pedobacter sp. BMA]
MDIKAFSQNIVKPLLLGYIALWLGIYLCSRFFLVMYSDKGMFQFWPWLAISIAPFSLYAALRTVYAERVKLYGAIGYFFIYTLLGIFATGYMIVNGDILASAAFSSSHVKDATLVDVQKVFHRKTGFDHTDVRVNVDGRVFTMEARPYAFFYLKGRKQLKLNIGRSGLGNDYVTSIEVSAGDQLKARWIHFKDMIYRMRWFFGVIVVVVGGAILFGKYIPEKRLQKRKPVAFWKIMALTMGILMGLGLLFYAGLWIWVWLR